MIDLTKNYSKYESQLKSVRITDYISLGFLIVVCIIVIILLVWWYRSEKDEQESFKNSKENKDTIINKKQLIFCIVFLSFAAIGFAHSTIKSIINITYDINNSAYVIVTEEFTVTETDWYGRWNSTTYTIEYERDGEKIEINPNLKYWDLSSGKYTNTVLVYSLKSEIVLDVLRD